MPPKERRWGSLLCFGAVILTTPFNLVLGYFCYIGLESLSIPHADDIGTILPVLAVLHIGLFAALWAAVRFGTRNKPPHVRAGATLLLTVVYLGVWLGWSAWEYCLIMLSNY